MNQLLIIKDTLENKITWWHLAAFVILFPFDRFYSELVLISLLLHVIIHCSRSGVNRIFTLKNLILCSVFLLSLAGLIYSSDKSEGLKDQQHQMAILLFPLIFSLSGLDLMKYKSGLLKLFGTICVITVVYLFADAIRIILYNKLPLKTLFSQVFLNHNFSEPISMHATYLSMFLALSVVAFANFFLREKGNKYRLLYVPAIAILLIGLLQLASRAVLLAIIPISIVFPVVLFAGMQRLKYIIVALIVLLVAVAGIIKVDSFKKRFVNELKDDLTQASINNEVLEPRILRWRYVMQVVQQSPIIGHGSGSEKRLLKEKYFDNKLYNSYLLELNAHNQYMSIALKTGILGLVIFLLTLGFGFANAWRNRDIVFIAFMIIISIVSFSENILDVNKGIFFYAFFFSVFVYGDKFYNPFGKWLKPKQKHGKDNYEGQTQENPSD